MLTKLLATIVDATKAAVLSVAADRSGATVNLFEKVAAGAATEVLEVLLVFYRILTV